MTAAEFLCYASGKIWCGARVRFSVSKIILLRQSFRLHAMVYNILIRQLLIKRLLRNFFDEIK